MDLHTPRARGPTSSLWREVIRAAVALAQSPRAADEPERAVYIEDLGGRTPDRVALSVTDFARRHRDLVPAGFRVRTHTIPGAGQVEVRAVRAVG